MRQYENSAYSWFSYNAVQNPININLVNEVSSGAGDGIRTHDSLLGKQVRYHCVTPASEGHSR